MIANEVTEQSFLIDRKLLKFQNEVNNVFHCQKHCKYHLHLFWDTFKLKKKNEIFLRILDTTW